MCKEQFSKEKLLELIAVVEEKTITEAQKAESLSVMLAEHNKSLTELKSSRILLKDYLVAHKMVNW